MNKEPIIDFFEQQYQPVFPAQLSLLDAEEKN